MGALLAYKAASVEMEAQLTVAAAPSFRNLLKHWYYQLREERDGLPPVVALEFHHHFGPNVTLTFDDGPREIHTEAISAWLRDHNIRATFFMQGRRIRKYPEIVRQVDADGHLIGNHGYHHIDMSNPTREMLEREILDTQNALDEVLRDRYPNGYPNRVFRPPWGIPWRPFSRRSARRMIANFLREHGFSLVLWNADSGDWAWPHHTKIIERCRKVLDERQGGALMFHDSHAQVLPALKTLVAEWDRVGIHLMDLEEMTKRRVRMGKWQLLEVFVVSTILVEIIYTFSAHIPLGW